MDKRTKQHRHKVLSPEELAELGPDELSSFDTEAGRAAQGMREDIGRNPEPPPVHTGNPPSQDKPDEPDADVT